jgi:hypothetical protein
MKNTNSFDLVTLVFDRLLETLTLAITFEWCVSEFDT